MVPKKTLQSFNHTPEVKERTAQSLEEKKKGGEVKTPQTPSVKEVPVRIPGTFDTRICTTVREC